MYSMDKVRLASINKFELTSINKIELTSIKTIELQKIELASMNNVEVARMGKVELASMNNVELASMNSVEIASMNNVELANMNVDNRMLISHDYNVVSTLFSHHLCNNLSTSCETVGNTRRFRELTQKSKILLACVLNSATANQPI